MLMGTPMGVYETWARKNNVSRNVEGLSEDTRLFWIGQKKTEKVILYFHGTILSFKLYFILTKLVI